MEPSWRRSAELVTVAQSGHDLPAPCCSNPCISSCSCTSIASQDSSLGNTHRGPDHCSHDVDSPLPPASQKHQDNRRATVHLLVNSFLWRKWAKMDHSVCLTCRLPCVIDVHLRHLGRHDGT